MAKTTLLLVVLGVAGACSPGEKHPVEDVREQTDRTDWDGAGDQVQPEDVHLDGIGLDSVEPDLLSLSDVGGTGWGHHSPPTRSRLDNNHRRREVQN
jgi:hypothetical protein